jgi:hypothetical protein
MAVYITAPGKKPGALIPECPVVGRRYDIQVKVNKMGTVCAIALSVTYPVWVMAGIAGST